MLRNPSSHSGLLYPLLGMNGNKDVYLIDLNIVPMRFILQRRLEYLNGMLLLFLQWKEVVDKIDV